MEANLSPGNTKLGHICSVSLPPVVTCPPNAPCVATCYARRIYLQYPDVRRCYDENYKFFLDDRTGFFESIVEQFNARRNRDMFRFHVAGDIPNLDYLIGMIRFATLFPLTRVMAYTKQFDTLRLVRPRDIPKNLTICLSIWPKYPKPSARTFPTDTFPRVYMRDLDGVEKRIPRDAIPCSGYCADCGACYSRGRKSIYICEHGATVTTRIAKMKRLDPTFDFGNHKR